VQEITPEESPPVQQPGAYNGIWPPPPDTVEPAVFTFPFKTNFLFQKGSVPDFRRGTISISSAGITVSAKGTLRYEIRTPLLLVLWVVTPLNLIAYVIIEAAKFDQYAQIPWSDVQSIVLRPKKRQACIVYSYPNYKGVVKTFSLGFNLKDNYEPFVAAVQSIVPDRVTEGKLRTWNSPPAVVFMTAFLAYIVLVIIVVIVSSLTGMKH